MKLLKLDQLKISKNALLIGFCLLLLPMLSFAQGITARADRSSVSLGGNIHLRVTLDNLQSRSPPDFSPLERNFQIVNQQQSSVIRIINGQSNTSSIWDLTLSPLSVGAQTIPSLSVDSSAGTVNTDPIPLMVKAGAQAGASSSSAGNQVQVPGVSFTVNAEKTNPYQDERVLLTYTLATNRSLRNIQLGDLSVKDAVVEKLGEPRLQNRRLAHGNVEKTVVISFLVTPLKSGALEVPPLMVRAEAPEVSHAAPQNAEDSPFADDDGGLSGQDVFAQVQKRMQNMMNQFGQNDADFDLFTPTRSIELMSKAIQLNVLAPVAGLTPWLPASHLALNDSWSGTAKVGEPISRTLVTEASGVSAAQLPGFEDQLHTNSWVKVYSDQPLRSEKLVTGEMVSTRKDTFTIVPQKEGELRLPAIQLVWWDTVNHTRRVATLPEKIFQVAPGVLPTSLSTDAKESEALASTTQAPTVHLGAGLSAWMKTILMMSGLLIGFFIYLRRSKKASLQISQPDLEARAPAQIVSKDDLSRCRNLNEVVEFLQKYAQVNYALGPNASLGRIFSHVESGSMGSTMQELKTLSKKIDAALYGGAPTDLVRVKDEIMKLFFRDLPKIKKSKLSPSLPELNPN
jgi:hypothetical protein